MYTTLCSASKLKADSTPQLHYVYTNDKKKHTHTIHLAQKSKTFVFTRVRMTHYYHRLLITPATLSPSLVNPINEKKRTLLKFAMNYIITNQILRQQTEKPLPCMANVDCWGLPI